MKPLGSSFRDWRCRCGRLLFRVGPTASGQVQAKCARCKAAQVVNLGSTRGGSSWA